MPQPKAQRVNWADEAWFVYRTVIDMPSTPPIGLRLPPEELERLRAKAAENALARIPGLWEPAEWPIEQAKADRLRSAILLISLHISYRLHMHYKVRPKVKGEGASMLEVIVEDPVETHQRKAAIERIGVKFLPADEWAFIAGFRLGRVLQDRWVSEDWKRDLPLAVASIAGATASEISSTNAQQPRRRRPTLRDAKLQALRRNPGASWKELLIDLSGQDVVLAWDDKTIDWRADDDTVKQISVSRFQKYK